MKFIGKVSPRKFGWPSTHNGFLTPWNILASNRVYNRALKLTYHHSEGGISLLACGAGSTVSRTV